MLGSDIGDGQRVLDQCNMQPIANRTVLQRRNMWTDSLLGLSHFARFELDLQTDFLSCFVTCESNVESYATTTAVAYG
jgi:hypothetical protein